MTDQSVCSAAFCCDAEKGGGAGPSAAAVAVAKGQQNFFIFSKSCVMLRQRQWRYVMPKGSVSRAGTKKLKTTINPDGSQQYVRGKTPMARVMTANKGVETAARMAERAFRKGDTAASKRATRGASMLERAELAEAKKEMARRSGKAMTGRKTLKK